MKCLCRLALGLLALSCAVPLAAGCSTSTLAADAGSGDGGMGCPPALPAAGSACAPESAECGYSDQPNLCGASNCYCQGGAWTCRPTCIVPDSAVDGTADGTIEADSPAMQCTDASRVVSASDYDQSCQSDSDCVGVGQGPACSCTTVVCATAEINVGAYAQWKADVGYDRYKADVATTGAQCSCPIADVPCCSAGKCVSTQQCHDASAPDAVAHGDAGDASPE